MRTVVLGIIIYDDKVLIGKKRGGPHPMNLGGKWHVIGGKVEERKNKEDAIKREIREETGIEVEIERKVGEKIVGVPNLGKAKIVTFHCKAKKGIPIAKSDLTDVKWVDLKDF